MIKMTTGKVRFSYAHVWEPYAFEEGQEAKYSVCLVIPKKDKKTIDAIKKCIGDAQEEGKTNKWKGKLPKDLWNPLRDGDDEREDDPTFKDSYFMNAKSNSAPGIVDRGVNPILDQTEFYSGCYGKASISFYPFSAAGNCGVAVGLLNLQKLEDGDMLGGGSRAEDDFENEEENEVEL